jgi:thiol-disulfide isomerase/thioredoxin
MALTPSSMLPLGTVAPDFDLLDVVSGKKVGLKDVKSAKATVVMFICNHCPYVKHIQSQIVQIPKDYQPKGVAFVAISANDAKNYPEDAPDEMKKLAVSLGYTFPYLYDETQEVARAYHAECTPDFYIFDGNLKCVYRGQMDDSRRSNKHPISGKDIREALDAILAGRPVNSVQKPSVGCNIKWKSWLR